MAKIEQSELQSAQILQDIGKMEQEIEREQIKLSQEMKEILITLWSCLYDEVRTHFKGSGS